MNVSSDLQLNDDIAFASFDALVGDLLNLTSNASEVISTSKSLSSSSTAMMIGETTTQDITDFILDDFTSKSTGMSASEDDLSFAAFDSINIQASNPSNVTDQSSPMTSSSDLMKSDNTTHPQSNITLVILSDELSDFNFDASNFSTSDKDNSEMSTVMSHTGKKKSSESSESSSAETSTLPDIANNITDSIMIDVLDSMNNTNTTISLMADDLSDSGESSDLAVTVTLSQRSTKLTRSSDATQAEATVALSAESSVESQENNDSSPQVSSVAPASSSSGDSAELALTRVSISATLTDIASSGEDNSSATTTTNSSNDSSDTTVVNQGPSSSATTEDVTTGSAVDSKSQENAEAGSTTNAKDSILDKSSKKSSESNENESREESESAEVSPSSPEPTAKSRKPPTSLVPAFDCQGKEEGPYANPHRKCSHYFYLCADDEYFVQFCPANMYYDKTRFLCDGFDNVFDCSGVRHTRPPAAAKITTPS
uniref:Chitin-binding type-2 domain-containing protein n=1 Tax=Romanomermis culicivorax TaxID=13658 RepID=A0A915L796_ROMCU